MTLLLLFVLGFCGMWQKAETITLGRSLLTGPSAALLGSFPSFNCTLDPIPGNISILYQLFLEDREKAFGEYSAHSGENGKIDIYIQKKFNYDGRVRCKASGQNNTEITPSFSEWHRFKVLEPVTGAHITSNPPNLREGESGTLQCNIAEGNYVSYDWQRNDNPVRYHYNRSQNTLYIPNLSNQDNGKYACMASNEIDGLMVSNSTAFVDIMIKESPSELKISVDIVKNEDGTFSSDVKCWLLKGSKAITFTLHNNTNNENIVIAEELSDYMNASFLVPITLDENMGTVQCQADNGKQIRSKSVNLTVESVGGKVRMTLEKAVRPDSVVQGVWLYCKVERGTLPHYYWFLNNTRLKVKESFLQIFKPDHSGIAIALVPSSAGIYHCEASNHFDNTSSFRSDKVLITREVLNQVPTAVAAIVFTCFSLMVLAVSSCCIYGVVLRKRESRKHMYRVGDHLTDDAAEKNYEIEMNNYEDEPDDMDELAYTEDMDVMNASRITEPDQSEEDESESDHGIDKYY